MLANELHEANMILSPLRRRMWLYIIRQLRENFDPGVPVRVRSFPMVDYCGWCWGVRKLNRLVGLQININSGLEWVSKCEVLLHEWAHAMDYESGWRDDSDKRIHSEVWGVWYSKIYQHIFDTCWEDMGDRGYLSESQVMELKGNK